MSTVHICFQQGQIADEESKIEEERVRLNEEFSKHMRQETEAALKEQEQHMTALIGRLQVGGALYICF